MSPPTRRRVLAGVAAATAALAGCSGESTPTDSPTPPQYRDRFDRNLRRIDVRSLTVADGTVTLTYNASDVSESAIRADTQTVAIAWSQVVGAGWPVDRLRVRVYHEGRRVASYRIEASWAEKYNDRTGGFDAEEYGSRIESTFETVTPTGTPTPT